MIELINQYPWLLALAIFASRILDVSLGTVRILVGFRGYRLMAACIGFVEAFVWVIAVSQVLRHIDQWYLAAAYAAGFAVGNFTGITLERRLGVGRELARVISYQQEVQLAAALRRHGYHVVELQGTRRNDEPVQVLYVVERRRHMSRLIQRVRELDGQAVYTITDVKSCHGEEPDLPHPGDDSGFALRAKRK